mgnify:CR=1 FL=1
MEELKTIVHRLIEIFALLLIGLLFTLYILRPIYENYGISFSGNVWVNWFGVAYIFFVLYTLIFGLFIFKGNNLFKQRLTSVIFWLLFIGSNYVVFIPFITGENPF